MESTERKEESQVIQLDYTRASVGKILSAQLFDFFVMAVTGLLLLFGTLSGIQTNSSYKAIIASRNETLIASRLYTGDEETATKVLTSLDSEDTLTYNEKSQQLDDDMTYFFGTFINTEMDGKGLETYHGFKAAATLSGETTKLFTDTFERALTNADYDAEYYAFYSNTYTEKAIGYLQLNKTYLQTRNRINLINLLGIVLTFVLSYIIYYFVFPLIFSRGKQTLGMKLTKIGRAAADGFSVSFGRFLCRFLFSFFLVFLGSLFAFLIPLAVSFTMLVVKKTHQDLSDYVCGVYVVDVDNSSLYKDIYEYRSFQRKREAASLENKDITLKN
jgi:uncharacterized RDD family membrane protein YckC